MHFARQRYQTLSDAESACFDQLLEVQDPLLIDWLCNDRAPSMEYSDIVVMVLNAKRTMLG